MGGGVAGGGEDATGEAPCVAVAGAVGFGGVGGGLHFGGGGVGVAAWCETALFADALVASFAAVAGAFDGAASTAGSRDGKSGGACVAGTTTLVASAGRAGGPDTVRAMTIVASTSAAPAAMIPVIPSRLRESTARLSRSISSVTGVAVV